VKQLVRFQNTDGDVWRVEATGLPRGRQRFVIGQVFEYGFQFETPKALANLSPGLERSDNPGLARKIFRQTLKGFLLRRTLFRVQRYFLINSQGWSAATTLGYG
jgi:hypothetical protein